MKYFFLGLIAGMLIGLLPFMKPAGGFVMHPEWHGAVNAPDGIEASPNSALKAEFLPPIETAEAVYRINAAGTLSAKFITGERLAAPSGEGGYVARYDRVGRFVDFYGIGGERFWKLKSLEYPFLSHNSKLILLLNGDQSRIRLVDFHGALTGVKSISGRFCTIIAFAKGTDHGAAGFLDGSYYLLDGTGALIIKGNAPEGNLIKGLAVSPGGEYLAVHYGGSGKDRIRLCRVKSGSLDGSFEELALASVHLSRIPMAVNSRGDMAFLELNRFVVTDRDCDTDLDLRVPERRAGHAAIDYRNGLYAVAYSREKGGAQFFLLKKSGQVLFSRTIMEEPFLDCALGERYLMLRGAQNLYCYSYRDPAIQ